VEERKKIDPSMTFQVFASAIKVPKSYLSKALRGDADINFDQLYLAAKFLGYTQEQHAYLEMLLQLERCSVHERRKNLQQQISAFRDKHLQTHQHIEATRAQPDQQDLSQYYYEPINQIVH
ncbi:MAG: helix-turn-helix domain-containing protein, partial [bacterium]